MDIKVKENFEIVDFATMVDSIVAEYFDAEGNYTPHIGMLNAMRVFYNECVTESKFDIQQIINNLRVDDLRQLIKNIYLKVNKFRLKRKA